MPESSTRETGQMRRWGNYINLINIKRARLKTLEQRSKN
jgi:hypothetical protein